MCNLNPGESRRREGVSLRPTLGVLKFGVLKLAIDCIVDAFTGATTVGSDSRKNCSAGRGRCFVTQPVRVIPTGASTRFVNVRLY
ncbi:hypothetical protein Q31a_09790 [Aureliella helgolandensis]|uniref:Uncharacterized protein n=1 Tax=Aureliella helgolandensis TaxID=2527968 RepID=A0A518G258_9BACT|nr:hypothetical protein Q31a_09790 [Aureliella helgolandensis]